MYTLSEETLQIEWELVKTYMLQNYTDHIDDNTRELNLTTLTEDAIDHFDAGIDMDESYSEIAFYVYELLKRRKKI
jgi:hypothetical protein